MIFVFDIDGVIRDVGGSYRRALADTVEQFTERQYRPTPDDIDQLKAEGIWNNDWKGSQELTYRYWESQGRSRTDVNLNYEEIVDFFQSRYRGTQWDGYVATEPLLATPEYFASLTAAEVQWGFFSGATRGSAEYVLHQRLGLQNPLLIAMEDAPDKPDPTGLFAVCAQFDRQTATEVILYAGDTVADMHTITQAQAQRPNLPLYGVGILPPHVQRSPQQQANYTQLLKDAGAATVLTNIEQLTPELGQSLAQKN